MTKLRLFFIVLFVVNGKYLAAQSYNKDSLFKLNRTYTKQDSLKVKILNDLAFSYRDDGPDSIFFFTAQALHISQQLNYIRGIADSYKVRAIGYYFYPMFDSVIAYSNKALHLYKQLHDNKGLASVLNNIGMIYYELGLYDKSIAYYNLALNYRLINNKESELASLYNNIGNAYLGKGDLPEALINLHKALVIRERNGDSLTIADSYTNMGGVYFTIGNYDEALNYADRGRVINERLGNHNGLVNSLINKGCALHELKRSDEALSCYRKAITICNTQKLAINLANLYYNVGHQYFENEQFDSAQKYLSDALKRSAEIDDKEGMTLCFTDLAELAMHQNNLLKARDYLTKAYQIADEIQSRQRKISALKGFVKYYTRVNDIQSLSKTQSELLGLKEELFQSKFANDLYQSKYQYIVENQRQKIDILQKDQSLAAAQLKYQRLLVISLVLIVLLSVVIIYNQYRNVLKGKRVQQVITRQKENLQELADNLQLVNKQKDKVFSVMSHDLRTPVTSLISVMNMLNADIMTTSEFAQMRENFEQQLRTLNLMLDNLLHWSRANIRGVVDPVKTEILLRKRVEDVLSLLSQVISAKQIEVSVMMDEQIKLAADPDHIDIILRNLISNALKYTGVKGIITIAAKVEGTMVHLQVMDNGVGMSAHQLKELFNEHPVISTYGTKGEKGTGIGLLLTKEFVTGNGGSINVTSTQGIGTTFTVILPVN